MFRWLQGKWYARLRKIDLNILWPQCVEMSRDLDEAKAAFAVHAFHDPAWTFLGSEAICDIIDNLER